MEEIYLEKELLDQIYNINGKLIEGKIKFADLQIKLEKYEEEVEELEKEQTLNEIEINELLSRQKDVELEVEEHTKVMDNINLQKEALKEAIENVSKAFQDKITEVANSYGIQVDENNKWNFDFVNGKFIKV